MCLPRNVGDPVHVPDRCKDDDFISGVERRILQIKSSRNWEARFMRLEIELKNKWNEGRLEGRKEDILDLLAQHGEIPEDIRSRINGEEDEAELKKWLAAAAKADSMEAFREIME